MYIFSLVLSSLRLQFYHRNVPATFHIGTRNGKWSSSEPPPPEVPQPGHTGRTAHGAALTKSADTNEVSASASASASASVDTNEVSIPLQVYSDLNRKLANTPKAAVVVKIDKKNVLYYEPHLRGAYRGYNKDGDNSEAIWGYAKGKRCRPAFTIEHRCLADNFYPQSKDKYLLP
jgi:hypothetical protein